MIKISAKVEAELVGIDDAERAEFLASYGVSESGIEQVIRESYAVLGLVSYFTAGEKEVRAWTIERGWKAPKAASVIHTDFEKGFIRAEVMAFADYVAHKGEAGCRAAGVFRVEGKDYVVAGRRRDALPLQRLSCDAGAPPRVFSGRAIMRIEASSGPITS